MIMDIKEIILSRRSCRIFSDRKVEDSKIEELITAAINAPSACNKQAWKFIIVDSNEKKQMLTDKGASKVVGLSPQGILVLYRNDVTINGKLYKDYIQSASAAIENILLMANYLELGACWLCDLPRPKYVKRIFDIPNNYDVIAYIAIGYPKEDLTAISIAHYGDIGAYKKHKRKYDYNQVICHNHFTACADDSTEIKRKSFIHMKHFLLKRKVFGEYFYDRKY